MKTISFFENTEKRDFIDCRITSFRDFFRYYNTNLDSYDIFVLGQAMNSSVYRFRLKKIPFDFMLFSGSSFEFEQNILGALGVNYEIKKFGDDYKKVVKSFIDKNIPLIFEFDIRKISDIVSPEKKIDIHCVSDSIICGYDFSNEVLAISLKSKNDVALKYVTSKKFEQCIEGNTFPLDLKRRYYIIESSSIPSTYINMNKKDILRKKLSDYCIDLMKGRSYKIDNKYENNEIITGSQVFDMIIKNNTVIRQFLCNGYENSEVNKRLFTLYYLSLRDMLTPGSDYCYRKEFSKVLSSMADKLGLNELRTSADEFLVISELWRNLTRKLFACSGVKNTTEAVDFLEIIDSMLSEINEVEQAEFEKIFNILNS